MIGLTFGLVLLGAVAGCGLLYLEDARHRERWRDRWLEHRRKRRRRAAEVDAITTRRGEVVPAPGENLELRAWVREKLDARDAEIALLKQQIARLEAEPPFDGTRGDAVSFTGSYGSPPPPQCLHAWDPELQQWVDATGKGFGVAGGAASLISSYRPLHGLDTSPIEFTHHWGSGRA